MADLDLAAPAADLDLEALADDIVSWASRLAAATARWLALIGEFDRRRGWETLGSRSCAHWLNWRCGLDLRAAREHVRVAAALEHLPLVAAAFDRGELSFSKVRAITRVATQATEETLLSFARNGTAAHIERIVSAWRRVQRVANSAEEPPCEQRRLTTWFDENGNFHLNLVLPPEEGAVVGQALEQATASARVARVEAEVRRANAFVAIASMSLERAATTSTWERYQVNVHVDADVLADDTAEGCCHIEGGPALLPETARRLMCDATLRTSVDHPETGDPLHLGRRRRVVSRPLRRILVRRDVCCQFPGCTSRYTQAHHIRHWSRGGRTDIENLVLLCPHHHQWVHEGGWAIEPGDQRGVWRWRSPAGWYLPAATLPGGSPEQVAPDIPPTAILDRWDGGPYSLDLTVHALVTRQWN